MRTALQRWPRREATRLALALMLTAVILLPLAAPRIAAHAQGNQQAGVPLKPGQTPLQLTVDGRARTGLIVVPRSYTGKLRVPLVIVLHGAGGNALNGMETGKWMLKAEQEGFIVVGLQGTPARPNLPESPLINPNIWNDGRTDLNAAIRRIDDVAFVSAAIDALISRAAIDEDRVYVTGFSNGAGMTFRVGAELSDRVAAIAPASSHLFVTVDKLSRPVSMILFAGTADPLNPFNGGIGRSPWGTQQVPPFADSWKAWAAGLHCTGAPVQIYQKAGVTGSAYTQCDGGAEAQFYTVEGMGHAWAGGRNFLPESIIGKTSDAIDETNVIWEFFVRHPRAPRAAATPAQSS